MVKNSFKLQKRLKKYSKNWIFSKFSNDIKNVSIHCGGHYNIKTNHFEDFSKSPPPCQIGLTSELENDWQHFQKYLYLWTTSTTGKCVKTALWPRRSPATSMRHPAAYTTFITFTASKCESKIILENVWDIGFIVCKQFSFYFIGVWRL